MFAKHEEGSERLKRASKGCTTARSFNRSHFRSQRSLVASCQALHNCRRTRRDIGDITEGDPDKCTPTVLSYKSHPACCTVHLRLSFVFDAWTGRVLPHLYHGPAGCTKDFCE